MSLNNTYKTSVKPMVALYVALGERTTKWRQHHQIFVLKYVTTSNGGAAANQHATGGKGEVLPPKTTQAKNDAVVGGHAVGKITGVGIVRANTGPDVCALSRETLQRRVILGQRQCRC
jgi:hypothetical protein